MQNIWEQCKIQLISEEGEKGPHHWGLNTIELKAIDDQPVR